MYNQGIRPLEQITGFVAAALIDFNSGYPLEKIGEEQFDLDVAADGNTEVLRAKRNVAKALVADDDVEDILITLKESYHLIRPIKSDSSLFIYLVLTREVTNLALARKELAAVEENFLDFS